MSAQNNHPAFPPLRSQREIDIRVGLARAAAWVPVAAMAAFFVLQIPAAVQKAAWDAAWAGELAEAAGDG